MQIVHFECPDPPKGDLWSYSQAIAALPVDREKFYRLIRIGVFPRGTRRHTKGKNPQYRLTRKHMAMMLAYLESEHDFNPPADLGDEKDAAEPESAK